MDEAAAHAAAMQFAGGMSIAEAAAEWEISPDAVECAVRRALLECLPARAGGTKLSRAEMQKARSAAEEQAKGRQAELGFGVETEDGEQRSMDGRAVDSARRSNHHLPQVWGGFHA